jgi:hypothetical protein
VPWEALGPSTLVRIHWRAEPYRDKWVINTVATAAAPLVVVGVPGPAGEAPRISGDGAKTRLALDYWNEVRSVIKIGGSNLPSDGLVPAHITIDGLDIANAQPAYGFSDDGGGAQAYAKNAAAIHVEAGDHITIRGCALHDAGNGLFSGVGSSNLALIDNHIYDNGIEGSIFEHNSYTESLGILFEGNHYGPLRAGCLGNNLKDRSAGTVIRYNWIESGNRQLDLVETDYPELRDHPSYDATFVYGNVLVEPDGAGNSQIAHFGGDGGDEAMYRGTLYFFHNTVVSTRAGNTTLVRLSTNAQAADLRNNVVYASAGGSHLALSAGSGALYADTNWLSLGWVNTHEGTHEGTVTTSTTLVGAAPGFQDAAAEDYTPGPSANPLVNAAGPLAAAAGAHPVTRQLTPKRGTEPRPTSGPPDLGALERP